HQRRPRAGQPARRRTVRRRSLRGPGRSPTRRLARARRTARPRTSDPPLRLTPMTDTARPPNTGGQAVSVSRPGEIPVEDSPLPVDEADAASFASRYLDIARAMITDPSAVTRVEDLITDGVHPEAVRAWQVVSIGPALVSAAVVDMARQSGVPVDDVHFVGETNRADPAPAQPAGGPSVAPVPND